MKITPKLILGSALLSLVVIAAEIPEALPAGFLEQLPVMMEMNKAEYAAFLSFSQQQPPQHKKNGEAQQGENHDDH